MNAHALERAAQLVRGACHLVIFTGAGVSAESGVPTFRDALTGLWAHYDPQELATPQAFQRSPSLVWDWYEYRRGLVRAAQPNPAHVAIAQLQRLLPQVTLITQNVDALHEQAGSPALIRLHGSLAGTRCFFDCQGQPTVISPEVLASLPPASPPACPHCGRWLRPDVVWFGEALPPQALEAAFEAAQRCDVLLAIGTSGLVEPAASLPRVASRAGAAIIEVNPVASAVTPDIWLQGPAGEIVPALLERLNHA
jgi:NAD-dependent deacetylase